MPLPKPKPESMCYNVECSLKGIVTKDYQFDTVKAEQPPLFSLLTVYREHNRSEWPLV